jgi:hypothetical protein
MSGTIVKQGEVISIASGIYESYDRSGPFIATRDFDLDAIVERLKPAVSEPWEITDLMWSIPKMLLEEGFITMMPCRRLYLGSFGEFDVGEEPWYDI